MDNDAAVSTEVSLSIPTINYRFFGSFKAFFSCYNKSLNIDLSDFDPKVYPVTGILIPMTIFVLILVKKINTLLGNKDKL